MDEIEEVSEKAEVENESSNASEPNPFHNSDRKRSETFKLYRTTIKTPSLKRVKVMLMKMVTHSD